MMQCIANNAGPPYTHFSGIAAGNVTNTYRTKAESQSSPTPTPVSLYVPANPPFDFSLHEDLELLVAVESRQLM
jgi:hypothetical protein